MAYFRAGDRIERPCPQGRCGGDLIVVREQIPVRAVDAGTAFPVERKHLVSAAKAAIRGTSTTAPRVPSRQHNSDERARRIDQRADVGRRAAGKSATAEGPPACRLARSGRGRGPSLRGVR